MTHTARPVAERARHRAAAPTGQRFRSRLCASCTLFALLLPQTGAAGEIDIRPIASLTLPAAPTALAWHPDSRHLATGGWSGLLTIWDTHHGLRVRDMRRPTPAAIREIQYAPDGSVLVVAKSHAARNQPFLHVFDATTLQPVAKLEPPRNLDSGAVELESISIDPRQPARIALSAYAAAHEPIIFLRDRGPGKNIVRLSPANDAAKRVAFSPCGQTIAVGREHGVIEFHSAADGQWLRSLAAFPTASSLQAMLFTPDGRYLVAASNHESDARDENAQRQVAGREPIKLWDTRTLSLARTFDTDGATVHSIDVSSDGRLMIVGLSKGRIDIWDLHRRTRLKRFQPLQQQVTAKLSPDRQRLATLDAGSRTVTLWSLGPSR